MGEQMTFEFEQRPTIKGFPELRWTGKRPYRSTQYYPAQLRERYGEEKDKSNPGDIVFDCFMGSGTTQAVAMKLGRRFIGADINLGAIQTTTKRLISVNEILDDIIVPAIFQTLFEVKSELKHKIKKWCFYMSQKIQGIMSFLRMKIW